MSGGDCTVQLDENSPFSISPLLNRLQTLQREADAVIETISQSMIADLRIYYNHALVSRRAVVTDVDAETWKFDLASSLAAILFARERVQGYEIPIIEMQTLCNTLIDNLRNDIKEPWFQFATSNARRPTLIAMPPLPALNLGENEERFYVQAVSESWPSKHVSVLEGNVLKVNARASRRFVDDMVAGDLGGVELLVTNHEKSFIQNHSIGWITRYETATRKVTIIEIDPWAKGEVYVEESIRRIAHKLVKVKEQRLDAYTLKMRMHEGEYFADNLVLSRLLALDQVLWPIDDPVGAVDVREFIHVHGSGNMGLGAMDEEVLLKSLGSMTAKNKVRSAIAIATKARLAALRDHSHLIRDIQWNKPPVLKSRMIRCGVDGIYVRTRVPFDSLLVFAFAVAMSALGARTLIAVEGVQTIGEATSLALGLTLGVGVTYHNLRYKSWAIGETVRLRRMCTTDEEMLSGMSRHEMISTIAEAGSKGAGMDGILTCAYSNRFDGKFSVTKPLDLQLASKVGLKLRVDTGLRPVWVDLKGVRAVEDCGIWHAYGEYVEKNYLELTAIGPDTIGGD